MAKATIKSPAGTIITVEGTKEEVSDIISKYSGSAVVGRAKEAINRSRASSKEKKKRESASDLIINLREEGFFQKAKTLSDISRALEEKGYLYPVTTLSGVVLGLLKRGHLRRKKTEGRWVYGK